MASGGETKIAESQKPRVRGKIDLTPHQLAHQACMDIVPKLKVLKKLPPYHDVERGPTINANFNESSDKYVVLQVEKGLPAFVLLEKNPMIDGVETPGWWLMGYLNPGGSAISLSSERESDVSLTVSIGSSGKFPRQASDEDRRLLDDFAKKGRPHPYNVFSCLYRK